MKKFSNIDEAAKQVGQGFARLFRESQPTYIVIGQVVTVDEDAKTIEAIVDDDKLFSDIQLDVVPNGGNSLYLVPALDSIVMLGFIEGFPEEPFLLKTTKIDKVLIYNENAEESSIVIDNAMIQVTRGSSIWNIEDGKVSMQSDLIEMNGGENGGLLKIRQLLENINKNVSIFNSHKHSGVVTQVVGDAKGVIGNSGPVTGTQWEVKQNEVEDTKVTH